MRAHIWLVVLSSMAYFQFIIMVTFQYVCFPIMFGCFHWIDPMRAHIWLVVLSPMTGEPGPAHQAGPDSLPLPHPALLQRRWDDNRVWPRRVSTALHFSLLSYLCLSFVHVIRFTRNRKYTFFCIKLKWCFYWSIDVALTNEHSLIK